MEQFGRFSGNSAVAISHLTPCTFASDIKIDFSTDSAPLALISLISVYFSGNWFAWQFPFMIDAFAVSSKQEDMFFPTDRCALYKLDRLHLQCSCLQHLVGRMASRVILLTVVLVLCSAEETTKAPKTEYKKSLSRDCRKAYTETCFKLEVLSFMDKLDEDDNYIVLPGVSVVRENNTAPANTANIVAELARDFPNDPDTRLDAFLIKKITSYLNSHSIRLNLLNNGETETARGGGGGGGAGGSGGGKGGGGGGGMGGMMLAAGAMMKGTLMALALGGIAAIAGKALMTGLISLLLSAIIGLKALTHHGKSTTYEIVSKPIYTHSNSHSVSHEDHGHGYGHSSYGRSFNMPLPLGLQPEYKPGM